MRPHLQVLGEAKRLGSAEYIWLDDRGRLWSKTRVVGVSEDKDGAPVPLLERWSAQIAGSQVILSPCHFLPDPLRPQPAYLVLCETRDINDVATSYNHRARLREAHPSLTFWWGVRQPYMFADGLAHCEVTEKFLTACIDAGLMVHSSRAGSDEGVAEFKLGPRRVGSQLDPEPPDMFTIVDQLQIARHLLQRVAQTQGIRLLRTLSLTCSVYFSSPEMRAGRVDVRAIAKEVQKRIGPGLEVIARVSVADRLYTTVEVKGFEASSDPYLLLGRVLGPIYEGRRTHATEESGDRGRTDQRREDNPDEGTGGSTGGIDPDPVGA